MNKPQKRTLNQAEANNFDLNIFNLLRKAQEHAAGVSGATMKDRKVWNRLVIVLGAARSDARSMMHRDDVYETSR